MGVSMVGGGKNVFSIDEPNPNEPNSQTKQPSNECEKKR